MESIALSRRNTRNSLFALGGFERRLKRLKFHLTEFEALMSCLDHPSRYNTDAASITTLCRAGRERADDWIRANSPHLGRRSSMDIDEMFT
jgi:NTE family protein